MVVGLTGVVLVVVVIKVGRGWTQKRWCNVQERQPGKSGRQAVARGCKRATIMKKKKKKKKMKRLVVCGIHEIRGGKTEGGATK